MKVNEKAEKHFKKLQNLMNNTKGQNYATAGLEASKDPKEFLKKMKEPDISGRKGIAF